MHHIPPGDILSVCTEYGKKINGFLVATRAAFLIHKQEKILFIYYAVDEGMARTNKQGIAAKKAQLQKQASRTKGQKKREYPKRKTSLDEAKEFGFIGAQTNPKGNTYNRFLRGRKVCRETRMRIDPDGWRYVKLPSGGSDFVQVHLSGWGRRRMMKVMNQGGK